MDGSGQASRSSERAQAHLVLVVDDDARNRRLVRAILRDQSSVIEAATGHDALTLVEYMQVDLVILDVMMPGMTGHEVCRLMKAKSAVSGEYLPILMLTALGGQEARNQGLEVGADDFLTKPIDRRELLLRVGTFLRLRDRERTNRRQLEELEKFNELKDDLVALLVHDLRNPLTGIVGALSVMTDSITDESLQEDLQCALTASDKLREILEDLLQVRLLESNAVTLRREAVSAGLILDDAIRSLSGAARARDVHIQRSMAGDERVDADRKLVRRATENLLANAVRYSPPGADVDASVHEVDGGVEIEIADRGVGIPDALKRELFKKFGSVEAARGEVRRGYGLGLYLVNLVAIAHGGRARVRDRAGGGTTFGLYLPRFSVSGPAGALAPP
jgi:two-component system sensor histidine kinase/response regulator